MTTVSQTFAIEAQMPLLGEGVSFAVRQAAKVGKLAGIVNGVNTTRWNPETDPALVNWRLRTDYPIDLSYGPDSVNPFEKKRNAKIELGNWIDKYMPAGRVIAKDKEFGGEPFRLYPNRPLVCYVGRFDSYQKGLDRLDEAIQATLDNGGQFILMGSQEDSKATTILNTLESKYANNVLFIRDYKDENGRYHFQQGDPSKDLTGIGSLVRAATDILYIPSRFEPCGLVQFEGWLFGALAIGSNTGVLLTLLFLPKKIRSISMAIYLIVMERPKTRQLQLLKKRFNTGNRWMNKKKIRWLNV